VFKKNAEAVATDRIFDSADEKNACGRHPYPVHVKAKCDVLKASPGK